MLDIKKLHLKIMRLVDSLFVGNYKTAFKGRGIEFCDYRLYDESDDAKYIDFLASAREGKLLVKRFQEERELTVFFLLDISETLQFGMEKRKIETLLESFYTLAYSALKNNDKIGALIFNETGYTLVKPAKGIKTIHQILHIIDKNILPKIPNFDVNFALNFFNNLPIKNSLVFLITDKSEEMSDKNLKVLSMKNDCICINVFDRVENNLLDGGGILRLKGEEPTFFVNLYQKKKVLAYQKLRQEKIAAFKNKLHRFQISYLALDDTSNIFAVFFNFFKNR